MVMRYRGGGVGHRGLHYRVTNEYATAAPQAELSAATDGAEPDDVESSDDSERSDDSASSSEDDAEDNDEAQDLESEAQATDEGWVDETEILGFAAL
jgi:hypothetical protein